MSAGNPEMTMGESMGQFSSCDVTEPSNGPAVTTYEEGWTPIRAEEFERLPEWCIEIYQERMKGVLATNTNDDVATLLQHYLSAPKVGASIEVVAEQVSVETTSVNMTDA